MFPSTVANAAAVRPTSTGERARRVPASARGLVQRRRDAEDGGRDEREEERDAEVEADRRIDPGEADEEGDEVVAEVVVVDVGAGLPGVVRRERLGRG